MARARRLRGQTKNPTRPLPHFLKRGCETLGLPRPDTTLRLTRADHLPEPTGPRDTPDGADRAAMLEWLRHLREGRIGG
jgi:hypothetical protein